MNHNIIIWISKMNLMMFLRLAYDYLNDYGRFIMSSYGIHLENLKKKHRVSVK